MNNFALTETLARMKGGSADVGVANLRPPSSAASGEFFPDMARLLLLHAPKDEFYLTEYIAECRSFMKAYTPVRRRADARGGAAGGRAHAARDRAAEEEDADRRRPRARRGRPSGPQTGPPLPRSGGIRRTGCQSEHTQFNEPLKKIYDISPFSVILFFFLFNI